MAPRTAYGSQSHEAPGAKVAHHRRRPIPTACQLVSVSSVVGGAATIHGVASAATPAPRGHCLRSPGARRPRRAADRALVRQRQSSGAAAPSAPENRSGPVRTRTRGVRLAQTRGSPRIGAPAVRDRTRQAPPRRRTSLPKTKSRWPPAAAGVGEDTPQDPHRGVSRPAGRPGRSTVCSRTVSSRTAARAFRGSTGPPLPSRRRARETPRARRPRPGDARSSILHGPSADERPARASRRPEAKSW